MDCCLQRHARPPFARGLAIGRPLLQEERADVALRHRMREKLLRDKENSFPAPAIHLPAAREKAGTCSDFVRRI